MLHRLMIVSAAVFALAACGSSSESSNGGGCMDPDGKICVAYPDTALLGTWQAACQQSEGGTWHSSGCPSNHVATCKLNSSGTTGGVAVVYYFYDANDLQGATSMCTSLSGQYSTP